MQHQGEETRHSALYAVTTNNSNLQVEYADQSRDADLRVTKAIELYLQQARIPAEIDLGRRLQRDWAAYLAVRNEVLASILEGSTKEAVDMDLGSGAPSFERVHQDLDEIKRLYDEQASQQLATVDASFRRSVIQLIGVVCFTLAFATFSVWAIQRSRMLSAVQLAKMQMDFVASISHELRTPLTVICSAAENIADGVVAGEDQLLRYGSIIRTQGRQITDLVDEILVCAATREKSTGYVVGPLQVSQIVELAVGNTAEMLQRAGFTVEQHIEPELPLVMGDLQAFARCLKNLLINAVKYSGDSRWIGVQAFVAKEIGGTESEVCISVQDRGIGIDSTEIPHVFEPFYRSPAVTAAQIHGTGLGLPLVRSIAEAMGARVTMQSKLGVGSVFTLHFPIARDANQRKSPAIAGQDVAAK